MIFAGRVNAVDFRLAVLSRRPLRVVGAFAVLAMGLMVTLASCSGVSSVPKGSASATPEEVSVWFDQVADAMHPCDTASRQTSDAIEAFAARSDGADHDLALVLAAGNGIEECSSLTGAGLTLSRFTDIPTPIVPLVDAATRWVAAMESANGAVLVAAADNLDNRLFVGEAFDKQADANAVADELDVVLARLLSEADLKPSENVELLRWNVEVQ